MLLLKTPATDNPREKEQGLRHQEDQKELDHLGRS